MNATTSYAGYVRRIDARLRSIHPNLVTQIYEVQTNQFVITFDSALEDASAISDEFDNSIRFMGVAVTLSNTVPVKYLREISPLSDAEASGNMTGLPLRAIDLLNLLVSRFPDAGIISVQDVPIDRTIILILQKAPDVATESQLIEFVDSFDGPLKVKIETRPGQLPEATPDAVNPMFVWASRLRSAAPTYVTKDEAFWFENIGEISSNQFNIDRFPGIRDGAFRCYLDLTLGGDHINGVVA